MLAIAAVVSFALLICGMDEVTFRDFVIGIGAGGAFFGIIGFFA
jgi:hypothetical protein